MFNWLLARGSGGTLLLRIEDTDRERSTPENIEQILDALRWLQLDWDEGPVMQTERLSRHIEVLDALLASGRAYRCSATAEDVAAYKREHGAEMGFRGSVQSTGAVRLRVPDEGETIVGDLIRGETVFRHVHLDDPVIARADGSPLYNFAVAIDDLDGRISHVVRGEDHLSNTPKQLLVLQAAREAGFGDDAPLPIYAHLPLLHGPDGKKLSKRHGAASVQELRDAGYLPQATRNYLALLGWGDSDDETVISTEDLIAKFSIERVSKSPARFDEVKLRWLNGVYIRSMPEARLAELIEGFVAAADPHAADALGADRDLLIRAVAISREKIHTLADFWPLSGFFFERRAIDAGARKRWLDARGQEALSAASAALASSERFDPDGVKDALEQVVSARQCKPREVYQPVRVAICGVTVSPGIFESVALLGRQETLARIELALSAA